MKKIFQINTNEITINKFVSNMLYCVSHTTSRFYEVKRSNPFDIYYKEEFATSLQILKDKDKEKYFLCFNDFFDVLNYEFFNYLLTRQIVQDYLTETELDNILYDIECYPILTALMLEVNNRSFYEGEWDMHFRIEKEYDYSSRYFDENMNEIDNINFIHEFLYHLNLCVFKGGWLENAKNYDHEIEFYDHNFKKVILENKYYLMETESIKEWFLNK